MAAEIAILIRAREQFRQTFGMLRADLSSVDRFAHGAGASLGGLRGQGIATDSAIDELRATSHEAAEEFKAMRREADAAGDEFDDLEGEAGGLRGVLGMLGGWGRLRVLALTGAVVGLGSAVGFTGVRFNALQEQAQIAFTTMLGDAEQAEAFLARLADFASETPFEFEGLIRASQRLLAMGFAAEEIIPMLTAVGDAAAGLGGSAELIDRLTLALGQMLAKGKASGEELRQFAEAGVPALRYLADAIGVEIPEAIKMVERGAIDARTAIQAITEGMSRDFGGMMEQQAQTWNGLWSTLKDNFSQISGRVMGPFFEGAKEGLKALVGLTDELNEALRDLKHDWAIVGAEIIDHVLLPIAIAFEETIGRVVPGDVRSSLRGWRDDLLEVAEGERRAQVEAAQLEARTKGLIGAYQEVEGSTQKVTINGKDFILTTQGMSAVTGPFIEDQGELAGALSITEQELRDVNERIADSIGMFKGAEEANNNLTISLLKKRLAEIEGIEGTEAEQEALKAKIDLLEKDNRAIGINRDILEDWNSVIDTSGGELDTLKGKVQLTQEQQDALKLATSDLARVVGDSENAWGLANQALFHYEGQAGTALGIIAELGEEAGATSVEITNAGDAVLHLPDGKTITLRSNALKFQGELASIKWMLENGITDKYINIYYQVHGSPGFAPLDFSGVQPRAMGGPVFAGVPYVIGERGAELFVPNQSGTVVPNHQLGNTGPRVTNYIDRVIIQGDPAAGLAALGVAV